jgi:hypothetical protein
MDLIKMIRELRDERDRIDEAVKSIERLAAKQSGKRRGRPPKWLREARGGTKGVERPEK